MTDNDYHLAVEHLIEAAPEAVFDAFLDMYGRDRPAWIHESDLDLRVGGIWAVTFGPPGPDPFRERRVITELDGPHRLGYTATEIFDDAPNFDTAVELTFRESAGRTRTSIVQRGFPDAATRDVFAAAWRDVLGGLARAVATSRT